MPFNPSVFVERPSVWGEVRWHVSLGKALNAGPEHGLDILYHGGTFMQSSYERRCLKHDASSGNEYVVWFLGPHFVDANDTFPSIEVRLAAGVPWEPPTSRLTPFRVVHPWPQLVPPTGGEVGPFTIYAPVFGAAVGDLADIPTG